MIFWVFVVIVFCVEVDMEKNGKILVVFGCLICNGVGWLVEVMVKGMELVFNCVV